MKILIIPDVHLKPEIFDRCNAIMQNSECKRAVCVGDIADDWGCQNDTGLYKKTFQKAVEFAKLYPETLWCYGNHDLAYLWKIGNHPGFSFVAQDIVRKYLNKLDNTGNLAMMHRIDNVVFSHAGLTREFVDSYLKEYCDNIDAMIKAVNEMNKEKLWDDTSPIWARPQQYYHDGDVVPVEFLNVVGHTPMRHITLQGNLLTVDTFSTWSNGCPYGNSDLCWVDTVTREYGIIV